jgi:integrase
VGSWTPHDMRRTHVGDMLDLFDLATVQKRVGHSSPTTTARYDRRGDRAQQKLADGVRIPGTKGE